MKDPSAPYPRLGGSSAREWQSDAVRMVEGRSRAGLTQLFGARISSGSVLGQSSGLENSLFRAHIPGMATIVRCNCGAEYKRTEDKFLAPHTGGAVCTICGAALEAWWESIHVPSFELIKHPDRKPDPKTP
jgi:hypothetical protein